MSNAVQFSLSRTRMILLIALLALSAVLFYAAGILTEKLIHSADQKDTVTTTKLRSHALNNTASQYDSAPKKLPSPASAPVKALALDGDKTRATQEASGPPPPSLSVQVISFQDRTRAQNFADALHRQGFPILPLLASESAGQMWQTVRLGPYTDWDAASHAVVEVQRSYNVDAYVRPLPTLWTAASTSHGDSSTTEKQPER